MIVLRARVIKLKSASEYVDGLERAELRFYGSDGKPIGGILTSTIEIINTDGLELDDQIEFVGTVQAQAGRHTLDSITERIEGPVERITKITDEVLSRQPVLGDNVYPGYKVTCDGGPTAHMPYFNRYPEVTIVETEACGLPSPADLDAEVPRG